MKTRCKFNTLGREYGNMMLAPSEDLTPGETYTVTIDDEIRDSENLPMAEPLKFTFTAVDITTDVEPFDLFNGFDTNAPFKLSSENSNGYTGTCAVTNNASVKINGTNSARFTYAFSDNRNGSIVWDYTGTEPLAMENTAQLGMYVCGDFNHHPLYVGVTAGTDVKWLKVCDLDFVGWRHFTVSLADLDPSYTYLLAGMKIDQQASPMCTKGSFYIDDLSTKGVNGINDITADDDAEAVYYNLQGIRVDNPAAGIYIERRGSKARKVMIP